MTFKKHFPNPHPLTHSPAFTCLPPYFTFLSSPSISRFSTYHLFFYLISLFQPFTSFFTLLTHGSSLHFHCLSPLSHLLCVTVDGVISQTVGMAEQVFSKWAFERSPHHHHSSPAGGWDVCLLESLTSVCPVRFRLSHLPIQGDRVHVCVCVTCIHVRVHNICRCEEVLYL